MSDPVGDYSFAYIMTKMGSRICYNSKEDEIFVPHRMIKLDLVTYSSNTMKKFAKSDDDSSDEESSSDESSSEEELK
ncbi:hypothetical protein LWI29_026663 [Acer saccharum]|uniref:Uncharacterized protein n=1 Tax=Acer saccharum TaxID=4024 RepID=A0AA39VU19_ACESA|nr:hypothetical protein LWI29_026663 [Acer saccharum]